MNDLLHSLGLVAESWEPWGGARFVFQRPALFGGGIVFLIGLVYLIHRRQAYADTISRRLHWMLTAARAAILLLILWILAGPILRVEYVQEHRPRVVVLIDSSASMTFEHGELTDPIYQSRLWSALGHDDETAAPDLNMLSRADVMQAVLARHKDTLLARLGKRFDLRYLHFAQTTAPLAEPWLEGLKKVYAAPGGGSELGAAITQVLEESAGGPVAGIILLSDGQNTGGRNLLDAATAAGHAGVPIFPVPIGSARRITDVAIVDIFTPGQVFKDDTARIAATIESHGFDGRTVPVQLLDGAQIVDSREIVLRGAEQQHVELSFPAKQVGTRFLTVRIPVQPEEPPPLRANNEEPTYVRVSDEKLKLLFVDGWPRWDFRFLRNALKRDVGLAGREGPRPDILLEAELRRGAAAPRRSLPSALDDLAKYHVIILGDATRELLTPPFQRLVDQAVRERGVGLIIAAGPRSMPRLMEPAFLDLLPVRLQADAPGLEAQSYKPFKLELTPEGAGHDVMRFYDDAPRNQQVWHGLSNFFWSAAVDRLAPAAAAWAVHATLENRSGKLPVIAQHIAGKGKVLFVGTDSTWLWRRHVGDRFFYRFWGQAIHFVARTAGEGTQTRLEIRAPIARLGRPVPIELRVFSERGEPMLAPRAGLTVEETPAPAAAPPTRLELAADPAAPGKYLGNYLPRRLGDVNFTFAGPSGKSVAEAIRVIADPLELRRPNVHRPTLENLARASRGKLVEPWELASLDEELKGETKTIPLRRDTSLWDNWLVAALLVAIYCFDVAARRLSGLA